ncbi:MAG TPA: NBR1-Ig-like domain-containing protein [Chloroflexota bacterium]
MDRVDKGGSPTNRPPRKSLNWLLALALLVISCDVSTLMPVAAPTSLPAGAVNTIIAGTAQAAASQTAAAMPPTLTPTLTPPPTLTPSVTPSPTATFLFILSSPTRTATLAASASNLACQFRDQTPSDGSTMARNQSFVATWTVKNIGQGTWASSSIDFAYLTGDKLATVKLVDLPKDVAPDSSVTLKVPMIAPTAAGSYKTAWTLQQGKNNQFCRLTLSITVK